MKKLIFSILVILNVINADACTGIIRKADDGSVIAARTMEFGDDVVSFDLSFIPRRFLYKAYTPSGQNGATWNTKYAHVGFSPFGLPSVADGMNEKGLSCGEFYMPGWAVYQTVTAQESAQTIGNIDFAAWVLGNFATVDEVVDALPKIKVAAVAPPQMGIVPPLHYRVVDTSGKSIVVEYTDGKLHLYEAPFAVITNSPTYDWHMTNARNYIGLSALNRPTITVDGQQLSAFGQGSGALGLPGDFTPPSRFIRAGFLNAVTLSGKNAYEEVLIAFKILNQFDIPRGAIKEVSNGKDEYEVTQWTSAADLSGKKYYFHTGYSRIIRVVDFAKLDLDAKNIKTVSIKTPESIQDVSDSLK